MIVRLLVSFIAATAAAVFLLTEAGAQTQTFTVSLSPQDTFINVDTTNYSSGETLNAYTWPDYQNANSIVMKFNLSSLPQGAAVQSAVLSLSLVQADAGPETTYTITAHKLIGRNADVARVTGWMANAATPWTASGCCYNGMPLAQSDISAAYASRAVNKTLGAKTWTITSMVQEWLQNPALNYGLVLNADATKLKDRFRYFASMEHPNASLRPVLQITYIGAAPTPPQPPPAAGDGVIDVSPADTTLDIDTANYSTRPTLGTYTWPNNQPANAIALRFAMPALPQGSVIQNATLHLSLVQSDSFPEPTYTISAHKILGRNLAIPLATGYTFNGTSTWSPSSCCFNGYPLAQTDISTAYDQRAIDKAPGDKTWTVTRLVEEWLADPSSNFGMILNSDRSKLQDRYRYFASMEHPNTSVRPYLRIQYSAPAGSPTPPPPEPEPEPPSPAPPTSSAATGIAARYPGDAGIQNDPAVIFVEMFDDSLSATFSRWDNVKNGPSMYRSSDVPPGSSGGGSLTIPSVGGGVNDGGHLYRLLSPAVTDTVYVRYYIKYPSNSVFHHSGIWIGGAYPATPWPNPQAGVLPNGTDRFMAAAEQNNVTHLFDHYNYWMGMHPDGRGDYWGNFLLNNPSIQAPRDQWVCVEHMVKLNNPVWAYNGEHAMWLNGTQISYLRQGSPTGTWVGGIFTQGLGSTPFEGFRWRSTTSLNINWIWLQNYSPDDPAGVSSSIKYDHVVVAREYIGCLP